GPLYQQAMQRMHTTPSTTLVLGDRLDTDILGGIRLGMPTALLLTGVSQAHELEHSPILPTIVIKDLPTLVRTWRTTCSQSSRPRTARE
ncbi:MAG: HAD hydrolase-like protein, partial [Anaerolineae bacterium]|nr:HAD hydrolase-like protein [Anaerolineae bacterium]